MNNSPGASAHAALRDLPSVDAMLRHPSVLPLQDEFPRSELLAGIRETLAAARDALRSGHDTPVALPTLAIALRERLHQRARPNLRRVINATGIVLHTGLGRAPLADEALSAIAEVASGYCNLELDLERGERGDRHAHVRALLCELSGAEDALVVNNNAAATLLALQALANGREVIISRGQLVEIGGSYRMPDIMSAAGCRMIEVGTTNRTRAADYERAIGEATAALVHVHTSNYRIEGFTEQTPVVELVRIARSHGATGRKLQVIDDLGSGLLDASYFAAATVASADLQPHGDCDAVASADSAHSSAALLERCGEPTVRASIAAGADIVLFSGDKLLGGPQAGIVVGRTGCIEALRRHPLARAVRPDKLALAALEATLRLYRDPDTVVRRLPVLRLLTRPAGEIHALATALQEQVRAAFPDAEVSLNEEVTFAGGGSLPGLGLPTWVVRFRSQDISSAAVATALRGLEAPIICRLSADHLVLDCRTLSPEEAGQVPAALCAAVRMLADG